MRILFSIGIAAALSAAALAENPSFINSSVAVDILGQSTISGSPGAYDALRIREAEALLYSPADHLFDGLLNMAAHYEGTATPIFELHEAYIGSTKLIPRSRFRVGQYFLQFGRLNQFHRHDWPFTTAPKVQASFFDKEGLVDTGLEYSWLAPLPFFLEATAGVTNGYTFGHSHAAGTKPPMPLTYGRLVTYVGMPWDGGMQIGLNALASNASNARKQTLLGVDLTGKWNETRVLKFLLQSEVWYRSLDIGAASPEKALGLYVFPQVHLGEGLFLGTRFDYYSVLNETNAADEAVRNYELAVVPTLTWRSSEFALVRLSYTWRPEYHGATSLTNQMAELQAVFFLGAHPAHDF